MKQPVKMKKIPISAAAAIAKKYGYDQVIIYARKTTDKIEIGGEHMTSYGVNPVHCDIAGKMAAVLQNFMGWNKKVEHPPMLPPPAPPAAAAVDK